jgi:type II secretory pathway pseudopilin PulG
MEFFFIWIFSIIIGCLIGSARGQLVSGFVWSFILGPLGVIVVLCLPNLKKAEDDVKAAYLAQKQMQLQEAQLRQLQELTERATPPPVSESTVVYHVERNGKDLGEMSVSKIRQMLRAGTLSKQDHYFDSQMDEWIQIEYLEGVS